MPRGPSPDYPANAESSVSSSREKKLSNAWLQPAEPIEADGGTAPVNCWVVSEVDASVLAGMAAGCTAAAGLTVAGDESSPGVG